MTTGERSSAHRVEKGSLRSPWAVPVAAGWAVMLVSALRPLGDVDVYWHVLIGYDILGHGRFSGNPTWVYGPSPDWITTQWASEVLFAGLHHLFGWKGLIVFNVAVGLGLLGYLHRRLGRAVGGPLTRSAGGSLTFACAALAFSSGLQERPALISFVFLTVLSGWAHHALTTGQWPRWWTIILLTWVWAQFHGYWVMVPVTIAVVTILRLPGSRLSDLSKAAVLSVLASTAGGLTPAGTYGYLAPVAFRDAAYAFIEEWQRPELGESPTVGLTCLVGVYLLAAFRRDHPQKVAQTGWVLVCCLFAWSAARNVIPATLLIAPVVAATAHPWLLQQAQRRWHNAYSGTVGLLVAGASLVAGIHLASQGTFEPNTPVALIDRIEEQPGPRRVLNDYDLGGQVLAFTGPQTQVAIDSRADKYGHDLIERYLALFAARPGWRDTLTAYQPTDILIDRSEPLNDHLPGLGWTVVGQDGTYVLWQPDDTSHPR